MNKRIKKKKGILQRQEDIKYVKSVMIPGETYYVDCGYRLRLLTELGSDYDTLTGIDLYTLCDTEKEYYNDQKNNEYSFALGCCSFWNCSIRIVSLNEAKIMKRFYEETKLEFIFPDEWFQHPFTCSVDDWSRPQIKIWKKYIEIFKEFILKIYPNEYNDWIKEADKILNTPYKEAENEVQWEEIKKREEC